MSCAGLGALLALATLAGAPPHTVSVGLDLSGLDEESYRRLGGLALEKQAVLRLVQESFAVVSPAAAPEVLILLSALGPGGLKLEAHSAAGDAAREVIKAEGESLPELHLEVSQKLVELARAVSPPPHAPEPEPVPPAPAPVLPSSRWWDADVTLSAEAVFRKGGNDPQGRLGLRWGRRLSVTLSGALAPSNTSDLKILEWTIVAGLGWRQPLGDHFDVEIDAQGGALLHHYTLWNPYPKNRVGTHADWAASVPVTLSWRPVPMIALSVRVAGRVVGSQREHLIDDRVIWSRNPWALEAGGGLGARF